MRLLLDSPRLLVPRALIRRLASNKELLPLGHRLLAPLPSVRHLLLVNLPSPSQCSAAQPRIVEGFLPSLDQGHRHSRPPRQTLLPLLDQFSDNLRSAVLQAGRNQVNQRSAPLALPIQPLGDPARSAQPQGPDLGKLLSVRPIAQRLHSGNLRPAQLQHLAKPPHLLLHRRFRRLVSLHQIPRHSVNQRRYLVNLPLLPSVNQHLPLAHEPQLSSRPLAKAHRRTVLQEDKSRMQGLLPPISQIRSRRTGQV
jgi:hypothetical protein